MCCHEFHKRVNDVVIIQFDVHVRQTLPLLIRQLDQEVQLRCRDFSKVPVSNNILKEAKSRSKLQNPFKGLHTIIIRISYAVKQAPR